MGDGGGGGGGGGGGPGISHSCGTVHNAAFSIK